MSIFDRLDKARKSSPLNNRDVENLTKYKTKNYSSIYEEEDEGNIFDIVKSVRKEKNYSPIPIKEDKPETYWNLVINKPRLQSPAGEITTPREVEKPSLTSFLKGQLSSWNSTIEEGAELISLFSEEKTEENQKEIKNVINNYLPSVSKSVESKLLNWSWQETSQLAAEKFSWYLDVTQKPVNKLAYYNAEYDRENKSLLSALTKEMSDSWLLWWLEGLFGTDNVNLWLDVAREVLPKYPSIWWQNVLSRWITQAVRETIEWPSEEEAAINNRIFWGVQPWFNLNFTSLEENRRQVISSLSGEQKQKAEQFLEDNKYEILANDVLLWVATWVGAAWGIKSAIKAIPETSKALPILETAEQFINPDLNKLATLGWLFAANAAVYKWVTGDYVYWGNAAAEEWALASFLVLWLKGLWLTPEIGKKWADFFKEILSDQNFQNWVDSFLGNYSKKIWVTANFLDDTRWTGIDWRPSNPQVNPTQPLRESSNVKSLVESIPDNKKSKFNFLNSDKLKKSAKATWYKYDNNKSPFKNYLNTRWKLLSQQIFQKRQTEFTKEFWWTPADTARIKSAQIVWEPENIAKSFTKQLNNLSNDALNKLPEYLSLKSRLFQARKEPKLKTTIDVNWTKQTLWLKELEEYVDWVERKFGSLAQVSEVHKYFNWYALQSLYDSWIISAKQYDDLYQNPYYVPGKLDEQSIKDLWEWFFKPKGNAQLIKKLKLGSEDLSFSIDWVDNLFKFYEQSFAAASRNTLIKDLVEIGWEDLARIGRKWVSKEWYTQVNYLDNWKTKEAFLPNYVTPLLKKRETEINIPMIEFVAKPIRKITGLRKIVLTWPWNPLFQVRMFATEAVQAGTSAAVKWELNTQWLKFTPQRIQSALRSSLFGTKNSKEAQETEDFFKAISQYSTAMWADYWALKWSLKDAQDELFKNALITKKGAPKAIQFWLETLAKVSTDIEKYTSRTPNFIWSIAQQLKEQGISNTQFKSLVAKFYNKDLQFFDSGWFTKALKQQGIDPDIASENARWVFDYFAAGDFFRQLWNYVEYANLVPATGKQVYDFSVWGIKNLKNLSPNQKKRAMQGISATIGWYSTIAGLNYAYNFGLFQFPWQSDEDFKRRKQTADILRQQPDYTKGRVWIANIWNDGRVYFDDLWVYNNPLYSLLYAWTYTSFEQLRWQGLDFWALNKNIEDLTYFSSVINRFKEEGWQSAVRELTSKFLWGWLKPTIEAIFNESLYHGWEVYKENAWLTPNSSTSKTAIFVANTLDSALWLVWAGSEEWPLWEPTWWKINVWVVNQLLKTLNPEELGALRTIISAAEDREIVNNLWVEWVEINKFRKLFTASNKLVNTEVDNLYSSRDDTTMSYTNQQNFIQNEFREVKNKKDLDKLTNTLLSTALNNYSEDHKVVKYIMQKADEQNNILEWKSTDVRIKNLPANAIGKRIADLYSEWNDTEAESILDSLLRTQPNTYRTKQVRISSVLYSAKTEAELEEIVVRLYNSYEWDNKTVIDYIWNMYYEVRDNLNQ